MSAQITPFMEKAKDKIENYLKSEGREYNITFEKRNDKQGYFARYKIDVSGLSISICEDFATIDGEGINMEFEPYIYKNKDDKLISDILFALGNHLKKR